MRVLNTIGILVSIGIFWYGSYVNNQLEELVWSGYGSYNGFGKMQVGMANIGLNGAFVMLLIGLFYIGLFIANIKNINKGTVKAISILGIIGSALFVLINIFYIAASGRTSASTFPFMYAIWWIFALVCLAFSIVLLVQAVRASYGSDSKSNPRLQDNVQDDFDVI